MTNSIPPTASLDQVWPKIKGHSVAQPLGAEQIRMKNQVLSMHSN